MSDEKNPKEASNIFHSIMKASVTPNKTISDKEIKDAVFKKFNVEIERQQGGLFGYADSSNENRHELAKEISQFIKDFKK